MTRLVGVARAAKMLGIGRSKLQGQIRKGELPTFEGQIDLDLLQDLYPTARLDSSVSVDRARHIKETAFGRRVVDRVLVEEEMLSTKVHNLQRDLSIERLRAKRYQDIVDDLGRQLNKLQENASLEQSMTIACLKGWLLEQMKKV